MLLSVVRAVTQTWEAVQTTPLWGKLQEYSQTTRCRFSGIKQRTVSVVQAMPGMEVSDEATAVEEETAVGSEETAPTQT
jgi:hypothetical protein